MRLSVVGGGAVALEPTERGPAVRRGPRARPPVSTDPAAPRTVPRIEA